MKVLKFPLARISIVFIVGIIASFYWTPGVTGVVVLSSISFLLFLITYIFAVKRQVQRPYFAIATYWLTFVIGFSSLTFHDDLLDNNHYVHHVKGGDSQHTVAFTLKERLKPTANNLRYVAEVHHLDDMESTGQILVNFRKDGFDKNLVIGSQVLAVAEINLHQKPLNPGQFDYGNYLKQKSVFAQIYVSASDIRVNPHIHKDWWYYSDKLRSRMVRNLEKSGFGRDELAVINALILGQRQDISAEIVQDYQFAGAIHILSVSGLHVGLLLLMLNFILRIIPQSHLGSISKLVIVIIGLWIFALIAGFSPSVVRSVTMFSFVAVGIYMKRRTNSYHTLLFSMLVILLFKPSFLFDVGFQLSYLAVFFILWLQPLLSQLWKPKFKVTRHLWDILTVSFAAQLGTMPLGLYYFHQFPGLFFITNLVILPALGLIMGYGVIILLLSLFGTLPSYLIKGLEWSIYALNKIIGWIASFEDFVFRDIPFNAWLMIGLYGVIVTAVIWWNKPRYATMVATMIAVVLFQAILVINNMHYSNSNELVIFNTKRNTLIVERNGREGHVFSDSTTTIEYSPLDAYLTANFCQAVAEKPIGNLLYFDTKKILIVDSTAVYPATIQPDVLLLIQSPKVNMERLLQTYRPEMIIADASNYKSYVERWKATCEQQKIPFHAIAEKGFYSIKQ